MVMAVKCEVQVVSRLVLQDCSEDVEVRNEDSETRDDPKDTGRYQDHNLIHFCRDAGKFQEGHDITKEIVGSTGITEG